MLYGTMVSLTKHAQCAPPRWLTRLRAWIKSRVTR